ncbi:hypothetical protein V8F06_002549 [Rhypophila decipiens]
MPPKKAVAAADDNGTAGADSGSNSSPAILVKGKVPSDGDTRFFMAMIGNLITKPDVNWEEVAQTMGLKDVKCTKERWRQITKKYEFEYQESATATPAKGRGRKPAAVNTEAANAEDDADEGAVPATPKPKTGGRGRKAVAAKSAEFVPKDEDMEDEATEETTLGESGTTNDPVTPAPAKTPRSRKPASSTKKRSSPDADDGDAEEGTPAKKKATPRKRGPNKKTLAAQAQAQAQADIDNADSEQTEQAVDPTSVNASVDASVDDTANLDTEMKEAEEEAMKEEKEETDSALSSVPPSIVDADEN